MASLIKLSTIAINFCSTTSILLLSKSFHAIQTIFMSSQKVGSVNIKVINRNLHEACKNEEFHKFLSQNNVCFLKFCETLFPVIVNLPPSYILWMIAVENGAGLIKNSCLFISRSTKIHVNAIILWQNFFPLWIFYRKCNFLCGNKSLALKRMRNLVLQL